MEKEDKKTIIENFKLLSDEDIKILGRYLELITRLKTLKTLNEANTELGGVTNTDFMDLFGSFFAGSDKYKPDVDKSFNKLHDDYIIGRWIKEIENEVDNLHEDASKIMIKLLTVNTLERADNKIKADKEKENAEQQKSSEN